MKVALSKTLEQVEIQEAISHGPLRLFALTGGPSEEDGLTLLEDALEAGSFRLEELGESGSVPELRVINDGGTAVLVLEGDELIGAKQNCVVNSSVLVAAERPPGGLPGMSHKKAYSTFGRVVRIVPRMDFEALVNETLRLHRERNVVFFLGAGASVGTAHEREAGEGLPLGSELASAVASEFGVDDQGGDLRKAASVAARRSRPVAVKRSTAMRRRVKESV